MDLRKLIDWLPFYFKDNDKSGILDALLTTCGEYLEDQVTPDIDELLNNLDIDNTSEYYLGYLWQMLGHIPFAQDKYIDVEAWTKYFDGIKNITDKEKLWLKEGNIPTGFATKNNDKLCRDLIKYSITLLKIRGSKSFFEIMFRVYGFDVEIVDPFQDTSMAFGDVTKDLWVNGYFDGWIQRQVYDEVDGELVQIPQGSQYDNEIFLFDTEVTFDLYAECMQCVPVLFLFPTGFNFSEETQKAIISFIQQFVPFNVTPIIKWTNIGDGTMIDEDSYEVHIYCNGEDVTNKTLDYLSPHMTFTIVASYKLIGDASGTIYYDSYSAGFSSLVYRDSSAKYLITDNTEAIANLNGSGQATLNVQGIHDPNKKSYYVNLNVSASQYKAQLQVSISGVEEGSRDVYSDNGFDEENYNTKYSAYLYNINNDSSNVQIKVVAKLDDEDIAVNKVEAILQNKYESVSLTETLFTNNNGTFTLDMDKVVKAAYNFYYMGKDLTTYSIQLNIPDIGFSILIALNYSKNYTYQVIIDAVLNNRSDINTWGNNLKIAADSFNASQMGMKWWVRSEDPLFTPSNYPEGTNKTITIRDTAGSSNTSSLTIDCNTEPSTAGLWTPISWGTTQWLLDGVDEQSPATYQIVDNSWNAAAYYKIKVEPVDITCQAEENNRHTWSQQSFNITVYREVATDRTLTKATVAINSSETGNPTFLGVNMVTLTKSTNTEYLEEWKGTLNLQVPTFNGDPYSFTETLSFLATLYSLDTNNNETSQILSEVIAKANYYPYVEPTTESIYIQPLSTTDGGWTNPDWSSVTEKTSVNSATYQLSENYPRASFKVIATDDLDDCTYTDSNDVVWPFDYNNGDLITTSNPGIYTFTNLEGSVATVSVLDKEPEPEPEPEPTASSYKYGTPTVEVTFPTVGESGGTVSPTVNYSIPLEAYDEKGTLISTTYITSGAQIAEDVTYVLATDYDYGWIDDYGGLLSNSNDWSRVFTLPTVGTSVDSGTLNSMVCNIGQAPITSEVSEMPIAKFNFKFKLPADTEKGLGELTFEANEVALNQTMRALGTPVQIKYTIKFHWELKVGSDYFNILPGNNTYDLMNIVTGQDRPEAEIHLVFDEYLGEAIFTSGVTSSFLFNDMYQDSPNDFRIEEMGEGFQLGISQQSVNLHDKDNDGIGLSFQRFVVSSFDSYKLANGDGDNPVTSFTPQYYIDYPKTIWDNTVDRTITIIEASGALELSGTLNSSSGALTWDGEAIQRHTIMLV